MPFRIDRFGFTDMMECRRRVRDLFADPPRTLAAAAERVVRLFHDKLVDAGGAPACALVRFFKTHPFGDLPEDLQAFARAAAGGAALEADVRCLTLLATIGDEPEWNAPELSRGHRAIPLTSVEMVEQAPMIAQLIKQMGLRIADVVRPSRGLILEGGQTKHNVFHVAEAQGSPYIVAQEGFVARYGIASVLGFGGLAATGDTFATIMFSKVPITKETADLFNVVGLSLKIALLPLMSRPLFDA